MTTAPASFDTGAPSLCVELAPLAANERIEVVDVLRGFAIFGILAVNMFYFCNPFYLLFTDIRPWSEPHDRAAQWLVRFFCEGKFYSLFSFLFGFGMAVQMLRAETRGARFVRLYLRRLLVLLGIGLGHVVLLWDGDILIAYALVGFVLLLFRKRRPKTLIAWAIPCLLLVVPITAGMVGLGKLAESFTPTTSAPTTVPATGADAGAATQPAAGPFDEQVRRAYEIHGHGTWREIFIQRMSDYASLSYLLVLFVFPSILGMFLLGLYAGRRGILHDPAAHLGLIRKLGLWGLGLGVVGNLTSVITNEFVRASEISWLNVLTMAGSAVGAPSLCLAYAAGIVLLVQKEPWRSRLRPLASVGRMALTNYLLQSLFCTTIYNGYGLGLYGQVGPALGLLLACTIYAGQIPLSVWWLRRFRFGPVEWLWRTLIYLKVQPMRVTPQLAVGN